MPASTQTSDLRSRVAIRDDLAVSEVVGQILMFGILSMVLILSFVSFNVAKDAAEERVVQTTTEALSQRISSLVVDTALFAEKFQDEEVDLISKLDLPDTIEGRQYTIRLTQESVEVTVPLTGATDNSTLFSANSAGLVHICDQDAIDGGDIYVRITPDSNYGDAVVDAPAACDSPVPSSEAQFYVYLETAI